MTRARKLPTGIDRIKTGHYRVRVSYEARQYTVGLFHTLGDARAALAIARSEIATRTFVPPAVRRQQWKDRASRDAASSMTVSQWSEKWLAALEREGRSGATIVTYRSALNVHILPALGDKRLVDVTSENVEDMLAAIPKTGARANAARVTRSMFLRAVDARAGGLTTSPVKIKIAKGATAAEPMDDDALPTPAQVRALTAAMPEHLRIAVPLAAWCSLRLGEVLGLRRRDFDLTDPEDARVQIVRQVNSKAGATITPPKSGSARRVAVPAALVPALQAHLAAHVGADPDAPLLPSPQNPARPISQSAFDRAWRLARDQVKRGLRFHQLRHLGLTAYARQGATTAELLARGGHKSSGVALRYQHASAARDRALTDKLNAAIRGGNDE